MANGITTGNQWGRLKRLEKSRKIRSLTLKKLARSCEHARHNILFEMKCPLCKGCPCFSLQTMRRAICRDRRTSSRWKECRLSQKKWHNSGLYKIQRSCIELRNIELRNGDVPWYIDMSINKIKIPKCSVALFVHFIRIYGEKGKKDGWQTKIK